VQPRLVLDEQRGHDFMATFERRVQRGVPERVDREEIRVVLVQQEPHGVDVPLLHGEVQMRRWHGLRLLLRDLGHRRR